MITATIIFTHPSRGDTRQFATLPRVGERIRMDDPTVMQLREYEVLRIIHPASHRYDAEVDPPVLVVGPPQPLDPYV